jgi:hypothetical protein
MKQTLESVAAPGSALIFNSEQLLNLGNFQNVITDHDLSASFTIGLTLDRVPLSPQLASPKVTRALDQSTLEFTFTADSQDNARLQSLSLFTNEHTQAAFTYKRSNRVSTDEQQLHGLGLEAQFAAIQEYAARHGGCVVAHYQEAATGRRDTLKNRPELVKALAHARRSGATLVFARWDRLSRNVSVTARLLESSIDFVACDNPYANRLTIHILAAMAEYESKLRSERLKGIFARRHRPARVAASLP